MARLDERTNAIQTLKTLVTIRAEGQPSVTASLSLSRSAEGGPPSFRLRGFDPLGRTLFDLVSIGDRVRLTIPGEGRVLEGGPDKQEDPSLPIRAAELRLAVTALIGPFVEPGEIPILERVGSNYLIHLIRVSGAEGRLTKRLRFERGRLRLVREEIFTSESGAIVVEFFDYQPRSDKAGPEVDWPGRMIVMRPRTESQNGGRLELEFHEVRLDAAIPLEEFRIP